MFADLKYQILNQIRIDGIRYTAQDNAPSTFEDLRRECTSTNLKVWSGASESTVYGDPHINHAFRAWHDSLHIRLNAPFTLDGEIYVAREQARLVGDNAGRIIIAEVQGQAEYFAEHGVFPTNQIEFINQYLKGRK